MGQATVGSCCRDALLKVIVQVPHRDDHVTVQYRRSDIVHLFADQTEVLLVEFQDQLFSVSDIKCQ